MDFWIPIAFSVLLELLKRRSSLDQNLDAVAKVYVKIEKAATSHPTLRQKIVAAREKEGLV